MVRVFRFADIPHPDLAQFIYELKNYQEGQTKCLPSMPEFSIKWADPGGTGHTDEVTRSRHAAALIAKVKKLHLPHVYCFAEGSMSFHLADPYQNLSQLANEAWVQSPASKYGWRVIDIKSVLRSDLHSRFTSKQESIRKELLSLKLPDLQASVPSTNHYTNANIEIQKPVLANHLIKTRISYHGTRATNISGIITHGFLIPGSIHPASGEKIKMGAGSTFGPGVYTSPNPHLALTYSCWDTRCRHDDAFFAASKQIIVCATVLGRAANARLGEGLREAACLKEGAHSHVANSGEEWILGNAEQVLPIFVVTLQWHPESSEEVRAYPDYTRTMAVRKEPMGAQPEDEQCKWAIL